MKQVGGVWLPDHETHLVAWLTRMNQWEDGRLSYQKAKRDAVLGFVRNWRTAIDCGAHVGTWSAPLAKRFDRVLAFEPVAEHRACFAKNVPEDNVELFPFALGDRVGHVTMKTDPTSSGDTYPDPKASGGAIPLERLDDILNDTEPVDLVKADCEGFELFALRGGEAMLRRCRPVVIVEQKPNKGQQFGLGERDAVTYLQSLGAVLQREISGDYILIFP